AETSDRWVTARLLAAVSLLTCGVTAPFAFLMVLLLLPLSKADRIPPEAGRAVACDAACTKRAAPRGARRCSGEGHRGARSPFGSRRRATGRAQTAREVRPRALRGTGPQ